MVGQKEGGDQNEQLNAMIDKIKLKGDNTSDYEKALLKWHKNVDKGYAWVVLIALSLVMGATLGTNKVYSLIFAKVTSEGIYSREEASWPFSTIGTVKNLVGPLISILSYHLDYKSTMLIGGVLITLSNCFTALVSTNIYIDVLLSGAVQGVGYAFVFIPFMGIVNSYFIKYRNSALGFALCGGTISVVGLSPLIRFILDSYPWRFAYYGIGLVTCIIILLAPLFKTNHMPKPEMFEDNKVDSYSKTKQADERDPSISKDLKLECETISINEVSKNADAKNSNFTTSNIWVVLKTPAFHLIWYCELMYFWVFCTNSLVLVDFAIDHGLTKEESEAMIIFESIGEVLGRLVLTALVDLGFLSNKNIVVLILMLIASSLTAITYTTTYFWMATSTTVTASLVALLYIMLNGLLIDYLGEQQVTLGYGMASCIVGVLITVRPFAVGFCRDYLGTYNPLMGSLAIACLFGALLWIIEPIISNLIRRRRREGASKELALWCS